jgi:hypothetical protein
MERNATSTGKFREFTGKKRKILAKWLEINEMA